MSVTVDHEPLAAEKLGMHTVGQVLSHVQRANRLVVNLLIDGRQPDLSRMSAVRQSLIDGHTLYIETAEPREVALEALSEVGEQLREADRLKSEAVELLHRNAAPRAMEKLAGCFTTWHNAQESVVKTAQLLRVDLEQIQVCGRTLAALTGEFAAQLRQVRQALEDRDYVTLADTLTYEMTQTTAGWQDALDAIREIVA